MDLTFIQWNGKQSLFEMLPANLISSKNWRWLNSPGTVHEINYIANPSLRDNHSRMIAPGDWIIIDTNNKSYYKDLSYLQKFK